ncbi:hypothetical protein JOC78_002788 [Bacillus ectoiniformans]|uniref:hypothetical protein n=1 Tax=Bacillus ectoiniformans TaxID=1494429 RepID=UPI0019566E49|nr:hypothetical protein [Bacillus ectoiniformans]MBM7649804.1 hypothetical protein [Bacillus ectoiniformans]
MLVKNDTQKQKALIESTLTQAGIKVKPGKKSPRSGKYSGIIGNSKKVLELKI